MSKFLLLKRLGRIIAPSQRLREGLHELYRIVLKPYHAYLISKVEHNHKKKIAQLKHKKIIRVVFIVIHASVWKLDKFYKMLKKDKRFEPVILICPYIIYGKEVMQREMNMAIKVFEKKNYRIVNSYNKDENRWIDIKKELSPDIVYFTNPHNQSRKEYNMANFVDTITCYSPYGFMLPENPYQQFNMLFHNLIWRCFYETPIHKQMAQRHARNMGRNVVVTGYPVFDSFIAWENRYDPWKIKNKQVKRIIWAPHHTIEENKRLRGYSNFLTYHKWMLNLLEEYEGKIQIAFKPHPGLRPKLYNHPNWGIKKTDEYFERWSTHPCGMLCESDYVDLFMHSDALIHDSISFIAEYFFTGKPALFLVRDNTIYSKFNEFGKMAFSKLYKSNHKDLTLDFISRVVLDNNDSMAQERKDFLLKYLTPPNGKDACENILEAIRSEL